MKAREIRPDIYWVGAVDWDRRLFDELIPLPDGTSYNSYLIQGSEKTVLIDTVDPSMRAILLARLDELGVKDLDYIVIQHAEQDHSGTLPTMLSLYPQTKVVCTPKCKGLLIDLLGISDNKIISVEDGNTISIGDKTLEFIHAPWVHWPETMLTYLKEDKILFPCDLFGSHLATTELYATDEALVYEAAKRYYAEIMMPFRTSITKHLERLQKYEITLIAPSHGPCYSNPEFILNAYRNWVSDTLENIVVLPYVSMHGSTHQMVDYLVEILTQKGITVKQFNLSGVGIGKLATALVDAATIVIGTPTVLVGPHPLAMYAAILANALRPKVKFASIIGSYGWGSRAIDDIIKLIPNLKVELLEPVLAKGLPNIEDFQALDNLASASAEKHLAMVKTSS